MPVVGLLVSVTDWKVVAVDHAPLARGTSSRPASSGMVSGLFFAKTKPSRSKLASFASTTAGYAAAYDEPSGPTPMQPGHCVRLRLSGTVVKFVLHCPAYAVKLTVLVGCGLGREATFDSKPSPATGRFWSEPQSRMTRSSPGSMPVIV